jgi:hypothetical protein
VKCAPFRERCAPFCQLLQLRPGSHARRPSGIIDGLSRVNNLNEGETTHSGALEILRRRADLSQFMIHLTRDDEDEWRPAGSGGSASHNFQEIMNDRKILAIKPHWLHAPRLKAQPERIRDKLKLAKRGRKARATGMPMPGEILGSGIETAKLLTTEYRDAIHTVRETVTAVPVLRDEEWSSLTKHVTELYILERFGYLRCCSGDSVLDGIIPMPGEIELKFDPKDEALLRQRGIQAKGRRKMPRKGFSTTGDVKLSGAFKFLYAVWVDVAYRVIETEVYRLEYAAVKQLIEDKQRARPKGKNNRKITHSEAMHLGERIAPGDGQLGQVS